MNKAARYSDLPHLVRAGLSLRETPLVCGRRVRAEIAAADGIHPGVDLEAELLLLDDAELDARRDALTKECGRT